MITYEVHRVQRTHIRRERGTAIEYLLLAAENARSWFVIDRQWLGMAQKALIAALPPERTYLVESSEEVKHLPTLEGILHWMQAVEIQRRDRLVVVGGGVLMDVGGLAAALYLRGIDYQLVPTSMIAQVDAAIGGKVGINFGDSKNAAGCFWHPTDVLIDSDLLATLPLRHYRAGLAECVKVACCQGSGEFFEYLEDNAQLLLERRSSVVDHVVDESVKIKWDLLSHDPFESDLNRLLNLGHTTAHALESATQYREFLHGEAVSVGLATAARFANESSLLPMAHLIRIETLLQSLGLPVAVSSDLIPGMETALVGVRRVRDGKIRLVVPVGIGTAAVVEPNDGLAFLSWAAR